MINNNDKKEIFIEHLKKKKESELRDYIIQDKFPSGKKQFFLWCAIIILFVFAYLGVILSGLFYFHYKYDKLIVEKLDILGESVCLEHGGYIDYDFKDDGIIVECINKSLLFNGKNFKS